MLLYVLQLLGDAVFAASGALAAGRRRMDLIGVIVLAIVTTIGGGTVRDVLLDRHPVGWIADPTHLMVAIGSAIVTLLVARDRRPHERALAIADALGLGLFAIGGAQIAEQRGAPGLVIVVMATITGTFGGVLRDVLSAQVPLLFRHGELYATAVIVGASFYVLLERLGVHRDGAALAGMAAVILLRLAAIAWGLRLPVVPVRDPHMDTTEWRISKGRE